MQIVFWLFPLTYNETTMGPAGYYSRYCLQHKYGKVGCQIQHIRASPQWGVRKRIIPHSSNHEVDLNASVLAGKATWCCSCTREGPCAVFTEDASDSLAVCTLTTCCRSVCSLSHHSELICILQLSWSHSCCSDRCNAWAPAGSTMLFRPSKPSREWVHMLPSEELGGST